jgi:hypothetical protein
MLHCRAAAHHLFAQQSCNSTAFTLHNLSNAGSLLASLPAAFPAVPACSKVILEPATLSETVTGQLLVSDCVSLLSALHAGRFTISYNVLPQSPGIKPVSARPSISCASPLNPPLTCNQKVQTVHNTASLPRVSKAAGTGQLICQVWWSAGTPAVNSRAQQCRKGLWWLLTLAPH